MYSIFGIYIGISLYAFAAPSRNTNGIYFSEFERRKNDKNKIYQKTFVLFSPNYFIVYSVFYVMYYSILTLIYSG